MTDFSKNLARLCRRALAGIPPDKRLPNYRDLLDHRLKLELQRIRQWGLAPFLLFVSDIHRFRSERRIPFSGGLGAESSSLAAYLLGLAPLEPVRHGFIFERLLYEKTQSLLNFHIALKAEDWVALRDFMRSRLPSIPAPQMVKAMRAAMELNADEDARQWWAVDYQGQVLLDSLERRTGISPKGMAQPGPIKSLLPVFQKGTRRGIPHFEGPHMAKLIRAAKIKTADDLICLFAISFRQPPFGKMTDAFFQRRRPLNGLFKTIPPLRDILADSRGLLLFQEQTMRIAREIASLTPMEANRLRRDLGMRRDTDLWKKRFIRKGRNQGFPQPALEALFDVLDGSAGHLFVKVSAAAHVDLALKLVYFKAHHPKIFNAELRSLSRGAPPVPQIIDLTAWIPLMKEHEA
ncbi:MAG: hypothetical protein SCM96_15540 [Acidobacteriota bacterium]|nr:hypothetical protein [Acidobacteriota bacterium]